MCKLIFCFLARGEAFVILAVRGEVRFNLKEGEVVLQAIDALRYMCFPYSQRKFLNFFFLRQSFVGVKAYFGGLLYFKKVNN